jgi:hypothetical protein
VPTTVIFGKLSRRFTTTSPNSGANLERYFYGLPKSKGNEAIFVVVDRLSKYNHFILLKHPYTAKTIAEVFVREVVVLHGIPLSIVSDRDPIFMSSF